MDLRPSDSRQTAEYAMALDLSSRLTLVLDEEEVFHRILTIFTTLFAPEKTYFWVMENGTVTRTLAVPASVQVPPLPPGKDLSLPDTTPAGFWLRIPYKDETIGIIAVDNLAFPEYRDRYLSLALGVAGVCGLAIANARTHSRLELVLLDLKAEYAHSTRLSRELQATNEQLEERVRQRTAELGQANLLLEEEVRKKEAAEVVIRSQLEEKTLLLRELQHRVKNNLQLIASLLSTQARKVTDPALQMALAGTKNRIRIMSAIHEKLWTAEDLTRIDLDWLVRPIPPGLLSQYRVPPGSVSISLEIPPAVVDINTAIPLGLIISELFANSLRHAFPGGRRGEIELAIREKEDGFTIRYADNGIGLPAGFDLENPDTVGFILVVSLVQQLRGTIGREPGEGTRFVIHVQRAAGADGAMRGTYNQVPE